MLPLSLYIHIPWCIQKCPYCDFNSHKSPSQRPEQDYIAALIRDLDAELQQRPQHQEISSIFIGGGTPSLFAAERYDELFQALKQRLQFKPNLEITLEAIPGAIDQSRFLAYRQIGINRLSIGVQSFHGKHLQALGRIHDEKQAHVAIEAARHAGFDNINIDLMHGLPHQTVEEGLLDLHTAIAYQPEHLSWYQLTIEPNTIFHKTKPELPAEETAEQLETQGFELLAAAAFNRYEISAFSKHEKMSQHNLNYWLFGDYYGIGAGAHGKWTDANYHISRTRKPRQPKDYMKTPVPDTQVNQLCIADCILEFMLNTTRLEQPISRELFKKTTGLSEDILMPSLTKAANQGLLHLTPTHWQVTPFGRRFTNNLQELFLPEEA